MIDVSRYVVLPSAMILPLLLLIAPPLLALAALLMAIARGGVSVATRLTLTGLVLSGLGTGVMAWVATGAALSSGLGEMTRRFQPSVGAAAGEMSASTDIGPRMILLHTANRAIRFVGVVRLQCTSACVMAVDVERPALGAALESRTASQWLRLGGRVVIDGRLYAINTAAIRDASGMPVAVLVAGIDAADVTSTARASLWTLLLISWALFGLVALSTRRFTGVIVTQRVNAVINRIQSGENHATVGSDRNDELDQLRRAVDSVIGLSVERDAQLRQAQKMDALGRLTGGIAHDFNNLLTIIIGIVPMIRRELPSAPQIVLEDLTDIERAAQRGAQLIRKLLVFSRADDLQLRPVRIATLVGDAEFLLRRTLPPDVRFVAEIPALQSVIAADATAVEQMLLNLATNARDAMESGGELRITVRTERVDAPLAARLGLARHGTYHVVVVSDTGHGMPESIRDRVLEPFFTTKPPSSGSGLGLSMVYGMMRRHDGAVRVISAEGEGTSVELFFPETDAPVDVATTPTDQPASAQAGVLRVLLVEDDVQVQRITKLTLEQFGYTVTPANDGQQALAMLRLSAPFSAVISDALMPNLGGPDLLRIARAEGFTLPFIIVSGNATEDLETLARTDGLAWVLTKPWTGARLAKVTAAAIAPPSLTTAR